MKSKRLVSLKTTLRLINRIRTDILGLPALTSIPKGHIHSPNDCPIALALDQYGIVGCYIEFHDERDATKMSKLFHTKKLTSTIVELPKTLMNFVLQFDSGEFPQFYKTAMDYKI